MDLSGRVAVVTGASYGVGRGVALGLAEAGAHVYATGRTVSEDSFEGEARIVPARFDHTDDEATAALFARVSDERGRVAAALALEYGFKDVDGKQPRPLTLEDV